MTLSELAKMNAAKAGKPPLGHFIDGAEVAAGDHTLPVFNPASRTVSGK